MSTRLRRGDVSRVATFLPTALLLLIAAGSVPAATTGDAISPQLQADLEAALRVRIDALLSAKNEDGLPYQRGTYSKSFKKVDDTTYLASFHHDTAGKDQVKTERLTVTLKKSGDGKWTIADEKVEDTYTGLYRSVFGDEEFMKFETFNLEREGLKVTATNGSLVRDFFNGRIVGFVLFAADLKYDYKPPKEAVEQYYSVYQYYLQKAKDDLVFKPVHVSVVCDPVTCDEVFASAFGGLAPSTKAGVDPKLAALYDSIGGRRRDALKSNAFSGFRLPWEEDRRQLAICLNKKGDDILLTGMHGDFKVPTLTDHNVWMVYDNYEPKEVAYYVTRLYASDRFNDTGDLWYSPILQYYSEETRKANLDPYALEYRPDVDSRYFEVETVNGSIDMAITEAETMQGDVTVGLKAKEDITEAPFFITSRDYTEEERKASRKPSMYVNSIQDAKGNELTWVKDSPTSGLVVLPGGIKAGESFTLRMQFSTTGSIYKLNPSFSSVGRFGWIPFVSFADIIDQFDLTIRVPSEYTVLGVGEKVRDEVVDDVRTTRWVTTEAVMFPSVTFGSYISDSPDVQAKKSDGTVIPVTVYVDKTSTNILDTDFSSMNELEQTQAAFAAGARGIRGKSLDAIGLQAVNSINLYSKIFGVDYPYARLDLVADPLGSFYGQAPSSLIYLGAFVFRGEGEMAGGNMISGGTGISKFLKSVVAHEVGHQWWGSSTVNASNNNYWFVESLAEFASALYLEVAFGPKEYQEQVDEWRSNILERDMTVSVQDAIGLATPDANYQAAVYSKGPYAFHVLRTTFGDEKLYAFLKELAQQLAGKEIATRDIQKVAEKVYGGDMEWFFDQWIRGVAIPEYDFEYTTRQTEDGNWLVQGKVKQKIVIGSDKQPVEGQYYRGLVPITVTFYKGKKGEVVRKQVLLDGPEAQFAFKVPLEPQEVAFNKYHETLSYDVNVTNN
jgi:hypothetical protein